jgi:hypothetical protein
MKLKYFTLILILNSIFYSNCWLFSSSKTEEKKEEPKVQVLEPPAPIVKEKHERVIQII